MYFLLLILLIICVWLLARKAIYKFFNFNINDKVEKIITVFFVVFGIFCSLFYLKYDSKSYDYGFDCTFCNKKLPYNLKPQTDRYYSFNLLDEDGFELVGKGFRYETTDFTIKDFLAYGYNDTSVIVKCTDSLNNIKYLTSYKTGYKSKKDNPEISFKDLSNNDFEQIKPNYQWVEIGEEKASNISRMEFLFMVGTLLSLFFTIRKLFKSRKTKATQ